MENREIIVFSLEQEIKLVSNMYHEMHYRETSTNVSMQSIVYNALQRNNHTCFNAKYCAHWLKIRYNVENRDLILLFFTIGYPTQGSASLVSMSA